MVERQTADASYQANIDNNGDLSFISHHFDQQTLYFVFVCMDVIILNNTVNNKTKDNRVS